MSNEDLNETEERITITELRKCKGFENLSDEKAEDMTNFIYEIANIFYNYTLNRED